MVWNLSGRALPDLPGGTETSPEELPSHAVGLPDLNRPAASIFALLPDVTVADLLLSTSPGRYGRKTNRFNSNEDERCNDET